MLAMDLGVFNKKAHEISNREALITSIIWISLAMAFSGLIWAIHGPQDFAKFQAAYWVEKALSVDNLFVFILVFGFFKIPKKYQHEVLFYGVLGAIIFRAIFIFAGVGIIELTQIPQHVFSLPAQHGPLNPIMFGFGIFLLYSGIKSWGEEKEEKPDISHSFGYRLVNKFFKVSKDFDGDKFFTIQNSIKMATPLFVALIIIELMDVVFHRAARSVHSLYFQYFRSSRASFVVFFARQFTQFVLQIALWPRDYSLVYRPQNDYRAVVSLRHHVFACVHRDNARGDGDLVNLFQYAF